MSRAAWYRAGKPTEVTQKRGTIYTADRGLHRARKIGPAEDTKSGTTEFVVERRPGDRASAWQTWRPNLMSASVIDWPEGLAFEIEDDGWEDEAAERAASGTTLLRRDQFPHRRRAQARHGRRRQVRTQAQTIRVPAVGSTEATRCR